MVRMEFYIHLISIVFFGFYGPMQCQNICENIRDETVCCINYHMENGECVGCPLGTYGVNCSEPCPEGNYGEFCVFECSCAEDEICDISYGCLDNSTEVTTQPAIQTELTTRNSQTTEQFGELQDDEPNTKFQKRPLFLYLVCGGCAFLLFVISFLLIYRSAMHTRTGITENDTPLPQPTTLEPENPQHGVANIGAEAYESDYAEIRECNPTYSSCAEVSSVYNVLSFSRSKYRGVTFNTTSALYSTSASYSPQRKEAMSIEIKSDETNSTQLDPSDFAAIADNQTDDDVASTTDKAGDSADFAIQEIT